MERFDSHQQNGTCDTISKCKKFQKILLWKNPDPDNHKCGENKCLNCKEHVLEDHKCYIQKKNFVKVVIVEK